MMGSTRSGSAYALGVPMIEFEHGAVQIDATKIGEGLGIEPSLVQARMREGKITSQYERRISGDAVRHRLTFNSESWRLSLIVDDAGTWSNALWLTSATVRLRQACDGRPPPRKPEAKGEG
jgi:Family of unknown function (DUF6522)